MACETCSHTMRCIGESGPDSVFWCWRCGTIRINESFEAPLRCARWDKLVAAATNATLLLAAWARIDQMSAGSTLSRLQDAME